MGRRASKFKRKRILFLGGGITGIIALAVLRMQDDDAHLRKLLKTVRVGVDWMRRLKRYLAHYLDPAAPQEQMYAAALEMGYPPDHVHKRTHDMAFLLALIAEAEIDAIVVVSYGAAIEKELIDAVNGNVFVIHPCRALPIAAKKIPKKDRGAAVVENAVRDGKSRVSMQIAMIRAEEVLDPSDPTEWDKGEIVARGSVFPGPEFTEEEKGPEQLSHRVRKTQDWIAPMYAQVLYQLPRVLGCEPQDLVDAGVAKKRVRQIFGFTPEELRDANLIHEKKEKKEKKKKKRKD